VKFAKLPNKQLANWLKRFGARPWQMAKSIVIDRTHLIAALNRKFFMFKLYNLNNVIKRPFATFLTPIVFTNIIKI